MVTVLEMLPEVIGSEELLGLVALPELVHGVEVIGSDIPLWRVREVFATVPTCVGVAAIG